MGVLVDAASCAYLNGISLAWCYDAFLLGVAEDQFRTLSPLCSEALYSIPALMYVQCSASILSVVVNQCWTPLLP